MPTRSAESATAHRLSTAAACGMDVAATRCRARLARCRAVHSEHGEAATKLATAARGVFDRRIGILHRAQQFDDFSILNGFVLVDRHSGRIAARPYTAAMDGNRKSVRKPRGKSQTHDFADKKRGARLQKVLADAGVAARRECEELILSGAVTVNGHLVDTLPAWANPATDRIEVYGRPLRKSEEHVYVVLFKPRGTVCTNSDPEGRPRAIDLVQHPSRARLYCVGRLDLDTSGLLVLTNDGEFANRLSHPRYEVPKGYDVTLDGSLGETEIVRIEREIFARDKFSRGARDGGSSSLRLINRDREKTVVHLELCEHRNLQIRPLMLELGHPVKKLRRTSFGPLKLKGLAVGEWRDLTPKELDLLRRASRHEGAGKALQPKAPKRSMEDFAEAREARAAALVQPESGTQASSSAPLAKPAQPRDGIPYNEEARPERTTRLSSKFAPKPFAKSSTKASTTKASGLSANSNLKEFQAHTACLWIKQSHSPTGVVLPARVLYHRDPQLYWHRTVDHHVSLTMCCPTR